MTYKSSIRMSSSVKKILIWHTAHKQGTQDEREKEGLGMEGFPIPPRGIKKKKSDKADLDKNSSIFQL